MNKVAVILDDEKEFPELVSKFLKNFGLTVLPAVYPDKALQIIQAQKPLLVFFDFKMPMMDGFEFLKLAKSIHPDATYILLTAYRDDATIERFKKSGAKEVLMKPVDLNQILDIVEKALK